MTVVILMYAHCDPRRFCGVCALLWEPHSLGYGNRLNHRWRYLVCRESDPLQIKTKSAPGTQCSKGGEWLPDPCGPNRLCFTTKAHDLASKCFLINMKRLEGVESVYEHSGNGDNCYLGWKEYKPLKYISAIHTTRMKLNKRCDRCCRPRGFGNVALVHFMFLQI